MTSTRICTAGAVRIGPGCSLAVAGGPCVLESVDLGLTVGRELKRACIEHGLTYIFKASFDKANRTSIDSPRGPGLERGLEWLAHVGRQLGVPVTTDIHEPSQAEAVAKVVDLIQIPAFLCRQTDLLVAAGKAAAKYGRGVNVKKGQFVSPAEMVHPIKKLAQAGCSNVMLTERGTFFGYGRLVNDFLGLAEMMNLEVAGGAPPVCFDVTHSTQRPGGEVTAGSSKFAPMLAKSATAAGVHSLFMECHPEPSKSLSDAATQLPLEMAGKVLGDVARVRRAVG